MGVFSHDASGNPICPHATCENLLPCPLPEHNSKSIPAAPSGPGVVLEPSDLFTIPKEG